LENEKYCDRGDLLFAWSASFGPFIWDGGRVIYHYHIWKLSLHSEDDLDKKYVYTFLLHKTREIKEAGHGISMIHMTKEKMEALFVPLPPLVEQRRIVAKVDELMALCDRIEAIQKERERRRDRLTTATLTRLNESPANVFREAAHFALEALPCVTTHPDHIRQLRETVLNLAMRGKLVPQDAKVAPACVEQTSPVVEKVGAIQDVAPFDLPVGWHWFEFGKLATFENGDRGKNYPNRDEYVEKGVPWINTGHIQPDGSLSLATMNYITPAKFASLKAGKTRPGDLLYCLRGATFGKTAIVDSPFVGGAIASSLMIVRPGPALNRRFAYFYLISPLGRSQLLRFDNGTAQPNLSSASVKKYLVPTPPLAEQRRIVAKVDELMTLCDRLEAELSASRAAQAAFLESSLRDALTCHPGPPICSSQ
jgi:type I restriction enzyme S subunit